MYENLGVEWAGTVVGFIALIFIPAPILFFKYGKRIRLSSRYAREADAVARAMAAKFQREKMLGSAAASAMPSRRASLDVDGRREGDIESGSGGKGEQGAPGAPGAQVDLEKAEGRVGVSAEAMKQERAGSGESLRGLKAEGARVGGEADAMALPAVQAARPGAVDVLENDAARRQAVQQAVG